MAPAGIGDKDNAQSPSAVRANAKLLIEIHGTNSKTGGALAGLTIMASNSEVNGLVINRFVDADAIAINQNVVAQPVNNVRIEGNFIGTDPHKREKLPVSCNGCRNF